MLAVKEKFKCNMKIIRPFENGNFTQVNNNIVNDTRLDLKEKGLMLHILSKPDGWFLNVDEIAKNNRDGKRAIYSGIKKLKELGYIELKADHDETGKFKRWEYIIKPLPSTDIENDGPYPLIHNAQMHNAHVQNRHYNNTNSNNTKVSKLKNEETNQLSEIENVENSVIEFADKVDEDKIRNEFDNLLDGRLQIQANLIDSLKKKASEFRKVRPVAETIELIKLLPEFVKASKLKNPDKVYEDKQSLVYLDMIIKNPLGNYPKWFLNSQKQEIITNKVQDLETTWKKTVNIWSCSHAGRIDDCIKKMVEKILNFVSESENYKKAGKPDNAFLTRFRGVFNEACINTLKVKELFEIIALVKEYIEKNWNKADQFNQVIENFNKSGSTLETIEAYFLQNKAGV